MAAPDWIQARPITLRGHKMKPLSERQEREQIMSLLSTALEAQYDGGIKVGWLLKQRYSVMPVPEDHFYEVEAERIVNALNDANVSEILVANWEMKPEDIEFAFVGPVSLDELLKVIEDMHPYYFVITDRSLSFLIYCTKEEYHLVVGSMDFVRSVLGTSLEDAVADFRTHASETWGGDDKEHLLSVLARYDIPNP